MIKNNEKLNHHLKNRHVQMIAIGGAIGTGFFLGMANIIRLTGPSVVLGYILGGFIIYTIMRALGEMTVDYPNSGSFVEYAHCYLGGGAGFVAGWNAWLLFTVACMMELTAIATLIDYWLFIPHWITCAVLLGVFGLINLAGVKYFGEAEFWFSIIKVLVIILMILAGVGLIIFDKKVNFIAVSNLHGYASKQAFFTGGVHGFLGAMAIVCLSFCGVEFVSVAAGEAENPQKSIPKAINGVVLRIILFYVLTIAVIMAICPAGVQVKNNPFADIFAKLGFTHAAEIINLVAITAAMSSLNSCIYVASRFLHRLSLNNQAGKMFKSLDKQKLPRNATVFTLLVTFLVVIGNYSLPKNILEVLFAVVSVAIIINWYIILLSHMLFRKEKMRLNEVVSYKMPGYPYINVLGMGALFVVMISMATNKSTILEVYVAPVWIFVLSIIYALKIKKV